MEQRQPSTENRAQGMMEPLGGKTQVPETLSGEELTSIGQNSRWPPRLQPPWCIALYNILPLSVGRIGELNAIVSPMIRSHYVRL